MLATVVAVGAMTLAACSPSKEIDSDVPPGAEPELRISAPSSAPPAEPEGEECAIGDFTVEGESGRQPKLVLPEDCTPPAKPLSKTLEPGEGPAAQKGDTVEVNFLVEGVTSGKVYKSWTASAESLPEQIEVGAGAVMPGWDRALAGMKAGGRKLLVLPPEQGAAEADQKLGFQPDETLVLVIGVSQILPG